MIDGTAKRHNRGRESGVQHGAQCQAPPGSSVAARSSGVAHRDASLKTGYQTGDGAAMEV